MKQKLQNNQGCLALDIHQTYHSFPRWWSTIHNKTRRDYTNTQHRDINISLNSWVSSINIKISQIKTRLMSAINYQDPFERINRSHNITTTVGSNPFITLRKVTNISKLRCVQYKTLLNIYPTKVLLNKWGISDDNSCSYCQQKETVQHVITDCQIAAETFSNLQHILNELNTHSSSNAVVLNKENITTLYHLPPDLAVIIIITKQHLLNQKENKLPISVHALKALIFDQHNLELKISLNQKKAARHRTKWTLLAPKSSHL